MPMDIQDYLMSHMMVRIPLGIQHYANPTLSAQNPVFNSKIYSPIPKNDAPPLFIKERGFGGEFF